MNATANRLVSHLHGLACQSVLETIRNASHHLRVPCAGQGTYGKYRVLVHDTPGASRLNPVLPHEVEPLSSSELAKGDRLACLATFQQNGELDRLICEQLTRCGLEVDELDVVAVEEESSCLDFIYFRQLAIC